MYIYVLIFQQESNKSEQQLGVVTLDLAKTSKIADGILKKVGLLLPGGRVHGQIDKKKRPRMKKNDCR